MSTRLWWFLLVLLLSKASASETGRSKNTIDHESSLCFGKDLICIPDSYDRRQRPRGDVEIYLLLRNGKSHTTLTTLTSIDQKKFTLSLTLHWVVFWYDERVNISSRVSPYIQLSEEIQAKLWTPMIDIYPMKSVKKPSQMFGDNVYRPELIAYELNSGGGLRAQAPNKNNRVLGLHHISYLELWCEMDFYKFPFDKHECKYQVYANAIPTDSSSTDWYLPLLPVRWMKFDPPYFKGLNLDYKAEMLLGNLTLSNLGNLATFTIHLERKFLRDVVEIIGPATLLVLVSWMSFIVPQDAVPGRMALLLTLFLCMINTLNSVSNNSARPHEGATAMVRWLVMCLIFILAALFEYAGILWYSRHTRAKLEAELLGSGDKKLVHGKIRSLSLSAGLYGIQEYNDDVETSITKMNSRLIENAFRTKASTDKIDKFSMIAFPVTFIVMSSTFWAIICQC